VTASIHNESLLAGQPAATADDPTAGLAAELRATASRFFAAALDEPNARTLGPADTYRTLRPGLADLGWFGLPADDSLGAVGAPRLTTPMFSLAGSALVPGPLLEDVVIGPALRAMLPPERADELTERTPFAFVDCAKAGRPPLPAPPVPSLVNGLLTGTAGPLAHVGEVEWLLVSAESPAGGQLLLLASDHPGIKVTPVASLDPCSTMAIVSFRCQIGEAEVLSSGEEADNILIRLRALARLALSSELHGISAHLADISVSYALQRYQFGRPIGSFQAVKHMLAAMACDVIALGNLVQTVADRFPADQESAAIWCAVAKSHASKVAVKTAAMALQVHGGIGFTEEHPLQYYYKRALALESRLGLPAELDALVGAARVARMPLRR
jgi:alkylation response protein AidB-like acyl-CoA dehydrogenase